MNGVVDEFEVMERLAGRTRIVRYIGWHEHLKAWFIYWPKTRSQGRRIERAGGYNGYANAATAWKTLLRTYPHREFFIDLPEPPPEVTVGTHEPGNTIPGGNGTWVRNGSRSDGQPSGAASDPSSVLLGNEPPRRKEPS